MPFRSRAKLKERWTLTLLAMTGSTNLSCPIRIPRETRACLQIYIGVGTTFVVLSPQKLSWHIWSSLYNITVEILRALTIKLTQARTRARDTAMARSTDRPRLRARAKA